MTTAIGLIALALTTSNRNIATIFLVVAVSAIWYLCGVIYPSTKLEE